MEVLKKHCQDAHGDGLARSVSSDKKDTGIEVTFKVLASKDEQDEVLCEPWFDVLEGRADKGFPRFHPQGMHMLGLPLRDIVPFEGSFGGFLLQEVLEGELVGVAHVCLVKNLPHCSAIASAMP